MMDVQKPLPTDRVMVYADCREAPSQVNAYIEENGALVCSNQLKVGDYIASDRVGIERKTVSDFIGSIMDQRLFKQLDELAESFECPVLIIEGNPEMLWHETGMHPNAIRGALASITIDHRVPIIWTRNARETAAQIYWIAFREQKKSGNGVSIRGQKMPVDRSRRQEYIVAGLPNVSTTLSRRLLEHFGSVRSVFTAKPENLMKIDKIGDKKARQIWELINSDYDAKPSASGRPRRSQEREGSA
jgi:Fanconi anemia group M protein